jgi:hypothetical protein
MRTIISREPWWAKPPLPGQEEMQLEWGYLILYSDGVFEFEHLRPSDEEIRNRKGCRVHHSEIEPNAKSTF